MFSEIHRFLRIYLTIPMSSATVKRTYSALKELHAVNHDVKKAQPRHVTACLQGKARSTRLEKNC